MSALPISLPSKLDRPASNDGFLAIFPTVSATFTSSFADCQQSNAEESRGRGGCCSLSELRPIERAGQGPRHFSDSVGLFRCPAGQERPPYRRQTQQPRRVEPLCAASPRVQSHRPGYRVGPGWPKRCGTTHGRQCRIGSPSVSIFRLGCGRLTARDRQIARTLGLGHVAKEAARRFNLSAGRVTQLRQKWQREWQVFRGEAPTAETEAVETMVS